MTLSREWMVFQNELHELSSSTNTVRVVNQGGHYRLGM